jgi:hypothetical protein
VLALLIAAGAVGVVAATAALWLEARRRIGRRCFAGLLALSIASSAFSGLAGVATAIPRTVPFLVTWAVVIALAVLFAVRLYRELRVSPGGPR